MNPALAFLLVAVGGGVGAAARFWLASTVPTREGPSLPWGTIVVNLLGSFLIGIITGLLLTIGDDFEPWRVLLASGLCGGFTTFSTTTVESVTLARKGDLRRALLNTFGTLIASVALVAAGIGLVLLVS